MNLLVGILLLKLICQIMQQSQVLKIFHMLIRFGLNTNLASLKTEVDKLDNDKLVPVPADLTKLSDVVKDDVVKKTEYDKLDGKVNNINNSGFVVKTRYDTDKSELENKIPDTSGLVKKADCNSKMAEIEGKISNVSGLATKNCTNYC